MNFVDIKEGEYVAPSIKVVTSSFEKCEELIGLCEHINDWKSLQEGPEGGSIKYLDLDVGFSSHPMFFEVSQAMYLQGKQFAIESETTFGRMETVRVFKFKAGAFTQLGYESTPENPREFCAVLNLNTVTDGGEMLFPEFDIGFKAIAENMILFPANFAYKHSENAPVDQEKYSAVAWFTKQ